MKRRFATAGLAAAVVLALAPALAAEALRTPTEMLHHDLAEMARTGTGAHGVAGIAAWRIDGPGPVIVVNADDAFPMASTFKVAVAGAILHHIEAGQLRLDTMITIDPDREIDSPTIADRLIHPGIALSIYNLLELMLTDSDNTATDYLLEAAGGPRAVTDWVRTQGVAGLRIDSGTDGIIRRYLRMGPGPFPRALKEKLAADPQAMARADQPDAAFDADRRDTATPRAMAELLTRLFTGHALDADHSRLLAEIMARDRTGLNRLRGMMPPATSVADKTGTIGGTINDVGVVTLPDGGRVVIVAFIKASDAPIPTREKAIAQIGRAIRDYYAYSSGGTAAHPRR